MQKFLKIAPIIIGIILVCIIQVGLSFVWKFTAWPEMLSYPYLFSKGYQLYTDIINPYTPFLTVLLYFFSKPFGLSVSLLRLVTIACVLLADAMLFILLRKQISLKKALLLLSVYIAWQWIFDANGLWFDLVIVPVSLAAYYFFEKYQKKTILYFLLLCGFFLAVAFMIKQTSIWWLIMVWIYLLVNKKFKEAIIVSLPVVLLYCLNLVFFPAKQMIYWTLIFPFFQASQMPGYVLLPDFKKLQLIILLLIPVGVGFLHRDKQKLLIGWIIASLFFGFPRFDYFHLQPVLPFIILLYAQLTKSFPRKYLTTFLVGLIIISGLVFSKYYVRNSHQPVRFFESSVLTAATELAEELPHNQPIYFYNTPSNYFVIAQLLPSKPWSDLFPWYLEVPGVQQTIITHLEAVDYVVHTPFGNEGKYALGSYIPSSINDYVEVNFEEEKTVNIFHIKRRKTL